MRNEISSVYPEDEPSGLEGLLKDLLRSNYPIFIPFETQVLRAILNEADLRAITNDIDHPHYVRLYFAPS
jgi:hypothetical protein